MPDHFNSLTPAEAERLAMLAEEAAEVAQICMKIMRHGYESYHPNDTSRVSNREMLHRELADLRAVHEKMIESNDLADLRVSEVSEAMKRKRIYVHHQ